MNEKLYTTIEQSKRLKELGIIQRSEFYWIEQDGKMYPSDFISKTFAVTPVSAFSVGELGLMLPIRFTSFKSTDKYESEKGAWFCASTSMGEFRHYADTEAECRAKALIYLLETKKEKVSDVNTRYLKAI